MIKIKRVLFPTDFSETAGEALAQAAELARFFSAELFVLHVVQTVWSDRMADSIAGEFESLPAALEKEAHRRISALSEVPELTLHTTVRQGDEVAPTILAFARETAADLLVMGTHGRRGLRQWLVGSVTQEVVRESDRPVLTLRRREHGLDFSALGRILVPVDFSPPALAALAYARQLAALTNASIDLLHVAEIPIYPAFYATPGAAALPTSAYDSALLKSRSEEELEKLIHTTPGPAVEFEVHVVQGLPIEQILEHSTTHSADLIVMGNQGLTGLSRLFLGSVTEAVMRRANRPLLVIRSGEDGESGESS